MGKAKRERRDTSAKWDAVTTALGPIKAKIRGGLPLTAEEQQVWNQALAAPGKIRAAVTAKAAPKKVRGVEKVRAAKRRGKAAANRAKIRKEYDPYSGASKRQGSRTTQGPAGGIRSVVSGGAPGLGKRH